MPAMWMHTFTSLSIPEPHLNRSLVRCDDFTIVYFIDVLQVCRFLMHERLLFFMLFLPHKNNKHEDGSKYSVGLLYCKCQRSFSVILANMQRKKGF